MSFGRACQKERHSYLETRAAQNFNDSRSNFLLTFIQQLGHVTKHWQALKIVLAGSCCLVRVELPENNIQSAQVQEHTSSLPSFIQKRSPQKCLHLVVVVWHV
jgi:hypothetical protein